MGTLTKSEDPDEMQHNAEFHQGLQFLLRSRQFSRTKQHQNLDLCPLRYIMDSLVLIAFIHKGESIRI